MSATRGAHQEDGLVTMSLDRAREELYSSAVHFATQQTNRRAKMQLEAAAMEFARAKMELAAGVPAAQRQEAAQHKRGATLCPSCTTVVVPARPSGGGAMEWLDARTFRPHRCGR